jgi:phosphoglycolate phosphatase
MATRYVLFDFDGVIADSFKAGYDVTKFMCPHVSEEEYRRRFEGNIHDWEDPSGSHTAACRLDVDFFDEYVPLIRNEVRPFLSMPEAIAELAKTHRLIVVSSTISDPIREFLEAHGLRKHFSWIMGADVHTSKVEKIKMVFEKYGVAPNECVFVTDTLGDIREAERAKVGTIGVSWGFQSAETLARGAPFRIIHTPRDLTTAISDYFAR